MYFNIAGLNKKSSVLQPPVVSDIHRRLGSLEVTIAVIIGVAALCALWFDDFALVHWISEANWVVSAKKTIRDSAETIKAVFYAGFALLLLHGYWKQYRHELLFGYAYLIAQGIGSVLTVRLIKILAGHARPHVAIAQGDKDMWIGPTWEGAYHSFPSGHSSDIFTSAIFASLLVRAVWLRALFLGCAVFVGWERIALAKHFLADVVFGALVGTVVSLLVVYNWLLPRMAKAIHD